MLLQDSGMMESTGNVMKEQECAGESTCTLGPFFVQSMGVDNLAYYCSDIVTDRHNLTGHAQNVSVVLLNGVQHIKGAVLLTSKGGRVLISRAGCVLHIQDIL